MASKRTRANKPEMIHCPYCGEDYSSTYKHCPFCDEGEPAEDDYQTDEYDEAPRSRGGKRLVTNTRGGGYGGGSSPLKIIGTVVSLALIVAAVIIVITIIRPLVAKGDVDGPADNTTPVESVTPTPDASPSETEPAGESTPPVAETPGDTIPEGQTATGFTLSKSEFTLSDKWPNPITLTVTFIPDGSAGKITWSSSDPEVVSVDENGKVSHGSKQGSATITATMAGGVTQTCLVHNSVTSGASSSSGSGSGASGALSLNRTDFTLEAGQAFQVKVSGTSSTPTWSIGNTAVATVSGDGTVKHVGKGQTTLTCTVDGKTLTCIVRCN